MSPSPHLTYMHSELYVLQNENEIYIKIKENLDFVSFHILTAYFN